MNVATSRRRPGFTLVELLTAVAIIVLLISVLIPALSAARTQAKNAATSGLLNSIEAGVEMFNGDFKKYPQSRGINPFEGDDGILLTGAQWLALQLAGADTRGFVEPSLKNDADGDKRIDTTDWLDWYALDSIDPDRTYTRSGPYADVEGDSLKSVEQYLITDTNIHNYPDKMLGNTTEPSGSGGTSPWHNGRLSFFVDSFNYPVLYYRANPMVEAPYTTGTPGGSFVVGRYDVSDNAYITGGDGNDGRYAVSQESWDLTESGEQHPLATLGYDADSLEWPEPRTFASFVSDSGVYENTYSTSGGRVWPMRPDSFLLISAGEDGLYGTGDDVTNFKHGN